MNGFVKDINGAAINAAAVIVSGKAPVISGSNGSFSVTDVTTPYDITLVMSTQKIAVVYKGLTRPDPVLQFPQTTGTSRNATISGSVPISSAVTRVFFTSGIKLWSTTANTGNGLYTINASWYDTTSVFSGELRVLRWTTSGGLPSNYNGYGSRNLAITAGGTFPNNNFVTGDLSDPAEQNISGSVVRPTGFTTVNQRNIDILFGNAWMIIATESGSLADAFSYAVANITGATFGVYARASTNRFTSFFRSGLSGGATGLSVTLETAPQLSLPVNNATNVDTVITFQWAQGGGIGVNRVIISDGGGNPQFYIYTTGTSLQIPNLAAQGLGLPSNTNYQWYVERYYPLSSTNDVASDSYRDLTSYNSGDLGWMFSETFTFTTRP